MTIQVLNSVYTSLGEISLPPYQGRQMRYHTFDLSNPQMPKGFEDYLGDNAVAGSEPADSLTKTEIGGAVERSSSPQPDDHPCDGFGPGGLCSECSGEIQLDADSIFDRALSDLRVLQDELKRLQMHRAQSLRAALGDRSPSPDEVII